MKVEILGHFGSDLMIANVARVSYGKHKDSFDEKDEKLIKYLVAHGHTSPFRHASVQFRVKCSIVVERQLFKYEVGVSKNSISGRYVDFSDSYDLPQALRFQSKSSKQGSEGNIPDALNAAMLAKMQKVVLAAQETYAELCAAGVSKEQARLILPLCLETTFIWTGSIQALIHMCNQRLKPDAQAETREVVSAMLDAVRKIDGAPFKHTLAAFGY